MTVVAVVGPTASGKSDLAWEVALATGAGILSIDSMQVYRGMDIGTAKPSREQRDRVPHAMVDVADPREDYTVARFQEEARAVLAAADRPFLLVGGSGLHYRAVIDPYVFHPTDAELRRELEAVEPAQLRAELLAADPEAGAAVDLDNPRRVVRAVEVMRLTGARPSRRAADADREAVRGYRSLLPVVVFGVDAGPHLTDRVGRRLQGMRQAGLLEEVAGLEGRLGRSAAQAVGYKELLPVVRGERSVDEGFEAAGAATLQLARRQRTWFRRDPRITWLDGDVSPRRRVDRLVAAVEAGDDRHG